MVDTHSVEDASQARRSLSQPVALVIAVLVVAVGGYLLASLSPFEGFVEAAIRSTRSNGMTALDPVFYGVAGLTAFVLLLALLRFFDSILKRLTKTDPLARYPVRSMEEFVRDAAESQISTRVARESYELLEHYYGERMCVDLDHDLRDELRLTDDHIAQLHAGLLSRTERREMREFMPASIETVHDLLDYVEKAPTRHLDGLASRVRSADVPNAECGTGRASGWFIRDQVSGQARRATDYIGPRRRASDNKVKRAYSGPHRRVTDYLLMPLTGKPGERPRKGSGERTAADPNKSNSDFIPPQNKRILP